MTVLEALATLESATLECKRRDISRCAMKKTGVSSILIPVLLLVLGVIAEAQQPRKAPRIGRSSTVAITCKAR